ncbi:hypothetical protein [Erwinia piriflorinigrans]|uniref:hypothetical protein n=1 Tax=Erwinia piriflorinigrans TaxID=665097 RepID=UPI0006612AA0|nr:hypothetical protein [Erwinia piriflorinigrans]
MFVTGFIFSLISVLFYIWNGDDFFDRKAWIKFGLMFLSVILGAFVLAFILKVVFALFPSVPKEIAGIFMIKFCGALTSILGLKFLVIMLCTIFNNIMSFHQKYNEHSYDEISSFSQRVSPGLLLLAKFAVSLGSVLIFYGIWLA